MMSRRKTMMTTTWTYSDIAKWISVGPGTSPIALWAQGSSCIKTVVKNIYPFTGMVIGWDSGVVKRSEVGKKRVYDITQGTNGETPRLEAGNHVKFTSQYGEQNTYTVISSPFGIHIHSAKSRLSRPPFTTFHSYTQTTPCPSLFSSPHPSSHPLHHSPSSRL